MMQMYVRVRKVHLLFQPLSDNQSQRKCMFVDDRVIYKFMEK